MTTDAIEASADRLWRAFVNAEPCDPISDGHEFSPRDAYAIQRLNTTRRLDAGAVQVGWKVGLTSVAIQTWLNVDTPDFGVLLDDMVVPDRGLVRAAAMVQPRAEGEVAFVLAEDLSGPGITPTAVIAATDFLLPAIEIIDSRVRDWKITYVDTVADNASSGLFVVGNTPVDPRMLDLRTVGMALRKNGAVVSTGAGAACLDHPVNAVAWLANTLAAHGDALRAGDIVLSGALGPVTPIAPGDALEVAISGLGTTGFRVV